MPVHWRTCAQFAEADAPAPAQPSPATQQALRVAAVAAAAGLLRRAPRRQGSPAPEPAAMPVRPACRGRTFYCPHNLPSRSRLAAGCVVQLRGQEAASSGSGHDTKAYSWYLLVHARPGGSAAAVIQPQAAPPGAHASAGGGGVVVRTALAILNGCMYAYYIAPSILAQQVCARTVVEAAWCRCRSTGRPRVTRPLGLPCRQFEHTYSLSCCCSLKLSLVMHIYCSQCSSSCTMHHMDLSACCWLEPALAWLPAYG